jgi:hypothetical protein
MAMIIMNVIYRISGSEIYRYRYLATWVHRVPQIVLGRKVQNTSAYSQSQEQLRACSFRKHVQKVNKYCGRYVFAQMLYRPPFRSMPVTAPGIGQDAARNDCKDWGSFCPIKARLRMRGQRGTGNSRTDTDPQLDGMTNLVLNP